tara:strand:+ start:659 stop:931 length:273 start_codon:yes stop_codon:yes gene_type:complete
MITKEKMKTRTMKSSEYNSELKVAMHIVLRNMWEYYLEEPDEDGIAFGLVLGYEDDLGEVPLDEIREYAISYAEGETLNDIMPAPYWRWV